MSQYKVIQDIEAEDKLLGPLTLRQFIYAGITVICLYLSFLVVTKGVPFLVILFAPIALLCGFFAFPWRQDQPTEIWALARIRFLLKPHQRVWDQSGVKELVTITAPKKTHANYTKNLSQTEVKSRLKALADTIDTRGWAVKNVNVNLYSQPQAEAAEFDDSDRLVSAGTMPQSVPAIDVQAADDILDPQSNPVAQNFDRLISASTAARRQQIVQGLQQQTDGTNIQAVSQAQSRPNDYWFLNQAQQPAAAPTDSTMFNPDVVAPGTEESSIPESPDERALAKRLKAWHDRPEPSYMHLRTIHPLSEQKSQSANNANAPVTPTPDPAIVELAGDNDKNVATLARLANRRRPEGSSPNEVVVSLH